MKRFRISWKEEHSCYVEAETEDEAVNLALTEYPSPNCDNQSINEVKEVESGS